MIRAAIILFTLISPVFFTSETIKDFDPTAPAVVWNFSIADGITITWTASTDADGIRAYNIYVDGVFNIAVPYTYLTYTVDGLTENTEYDITVAGVDNNGNIGTVSNTITKTTLETHGPQDFTNNSGITTEFGSMTITGRQFEGPAPSSNGNILRIQGTTGLLKFKHCAFKNSIGGSYDANRAVYFHDATGDIEFDSCFFWNNGAWMLISAIDDNILVHRNQGFNSLGPHGGGQMISATFCSGSNNKIEYNYGENFYGESYPEDHISINNSSGESGSPFLVRHNKTRGGGPSQSGGGYVGGENDGSYYNIDSNQLYNPGNYGVAIVGGVGSNIRGNDVWQDNFGWTNNGILCYRYTGLQCDNHTVTGNRATVTGGSTNCFSPCDIGSACTNSTRTAPSSLTLEQMAFPAVLITFVGEDKMWKLRADTSHQQYLRGAALAKFSLDGINRDDIERPRPHAGNDTTTTISTYTLSDHLSLAGESGGSSAISSRRWVQASGPNLATMSAATSSTNNVSGLITGVYVFRLEATATAPNYGQQADWVTVTVNSTPQTKFYISTSGSDAAAGTLAAPWQTIAKVNSSTFSAGDTIFFNRGNQWREQLTLPSSGAVNNRIVFTAYGTGAKPIINGADIKTAWVDGYDNINANIWGTGSTNAVTTRAMVVIDGVIYAEVATINELTSANKYFIKTASTPDSLYVYSTTDPDALTAEVSKREYCILTASGASSKKYIEISDIEVRYAGRAGIYFEGPGAGGGDALNGASYVKRCFAYANRLFGIVHYDHYDSLTVEDSKATYNGNGFYSWVADEGTFRRDTTSNQIQYNVTFTDGHAIGGYQSDNWLVENCYSDADYDAIHLDAGNVATDAIIRYNKVFNSRSGSPDTPGYGIGNTAAGAVVQMYYNLAVNCAEASQTSSSAAHAGTITVYNNTFYHNTSTGTNGIVYFNHGTGYTFKNNLYVRDYVAGELGFVIITTAMSTNDYNNYYILNNVSGTLRNWLNGAAYTTMAAWRTATSQDANSITVDPLFVNVASDWSLQSGSPCRNAGVSVGLTQDILGNSIVGNPDIGAYELSAIAGDPPYPAGRKLPVKVQ